MGGRGTFARGNIVAFRWKTVGTFKDVKVLELIDKQMARKLPEESHSSKSYILFDRNGTFHQYREYNEDHTLRFEIGYHKEPNIDPKGNATLHVHEYSNDMTIRTTRKISSDEYEKYKHLFKGVDTK